MALATLVHLQLQHDFLADIVRHQALGGAARRQLGQVEVGRALADVVLLQHIDQLGEGRGHPHALLVLHALDALAQHLLNHRGQVALFLLAPGFVEVHEHRQEGCLAVGGQEGGHLVLDGLHAAVDFLAQALFDNLRLFFGGQQIADLLLDFRGKPLPAHLHEGHQMRQGDGLPAVLVGGHLRHNLHGDVAGRGEGVRLVDMGFGNAGAVLQHILQVHQVAVMHVLGIVIRVMEVDDALLVGLHDVLGQQDAAGQVAADLAGHVVPLHRVNHGILVAVFLLGLLVVALDEAEDLRVGGVGLADFFPVIAVADIVAGHVVGAAGHDGRLHHVLDFLHGHGAVQLPAFLLHPGCNLFNILNAALGSLPDGDSDFLTLEIHLGAVTLHYLHAYASVSLGQATIVALRTGFSNGYFGHHFGPTAFPLPRKAVPRIGLRPCAPFCKKTPGGYFRPGAMIRVRVRRASRPSGRRSSTCSPHRGRLC